MEIPKGNYKGMGRIFRVLILTHGGPGIGGGHLSRCLALGHALQERGCSLFWLVNELAMNIVESSGFEEVQSIPGLFGVKSLVEVRRLAEHADFIVLDSYAPDIPFLEGLREEAPLMVVDDFGDRPVEEACDLLLNYNLNAGEIPYSPMPGQPRLLGPRWVLLRPEVAKAVPSRGEYVFFVAGATDLLGVTEEVIGLWEPAWPFLQAVLGPMAPEQLIRKCQVLAKDRGNVEVLVAPEDFLARMAGAGWVICTSSVTAYEALALKKRLAVFQVAENQVGIGSAIGAGGYGVNLGWWGAFGKMEIERILLILPEIPSAGVDSRGAEKVAEYLVQWLYARRIQ